MPEGIILASASKGATQEDLEKVLAKNVGEENIVHPEVETEAPAEPIRDSFDTEEEFEAAHVEWQEKQEELEAKEGDEEEEAPKAAAKKPSRVARKIERATTDLRKQLEEANKRIEALEGKKPPEVIVEKKRPLRADFEAGDDGQQKYEDALIAYGVEKKDAEKSAKEAQDAQTKWMKETMANYQANVEEFKDEHEDWDEVVGKNSTPVHKEVQLAIIEQENGAAVTYYLCTHPVYAKKLAEMSPLSAVMEVGRLSSRLKTGSPSTSDANGGAPPKTKPRVPPPVRPVNTAATSSTATARDAAQRRDFKSFAAARRAGR